MKTVIRTGRCSTLLATLLLVAGVSCQPADTGTGWVEPTDTASTTTRDHVTALGRVEPENGFVEVAPGLPDRVCGISVKTGDWVDAGAPLVTLETHDERRKAVALARTLLSEARRTHEKESALARARLKEAEASLEQARRLLPLDVEACRTDVERFNLEFSDARTNWNRFDELAKRDSVSPSERDHYELVFRQSQKALEAAKTRLHEAEEREDVEIAQAGHRVETARAALQRTLASGNLSGLEKRLEVASSQLAQSTIRAPSAGEILKIYAKPGESAAGAPLLLLGDTKVLVVVAEVDENDVGWVREGQRAVLTSRALTDRLTGSVESVGHLVARNRLRDLDPAAPVDRRVVEVRIRLDDPEAARGLLNLEVDVEITVASGTSMSGRGPCASPSS